MTVPPSKSGLSITVIIMCVMGGALILGMATGMVFGP